MTKPYKVDYLSASKQKGNQKIFQYQVPLKEDEFQNQLEALLIERHEQGYELSQVLKYRPINHSGMPNLGFMVIFKHLNPEK